MSHETELDAAQTGSSGANGPGRHITSATPQQCWAALDAAREQAFTGEILFHAEPEVHVYVDNGVAYYAERADDTTLGSRLLDAQVVDAVQLERGTVRVGGVEHLGRLFDRDPSVDRDAVMVMTEDATQALLADLANNVIASSQATAYRHHKSGVHRWFVAPTFGGYMTRPVSDVALVDNSVVEDLPGLPSAETGSLGDELRIEWDEPLAAPDPPSVVDGANGVDFSHDVLSAGTDDAFSEILESPFGALADDLAPATDTSLDADPATSDPLDSAAVEEPSATSESFAVDLDDLLAPAEGVSGAGVDQGHEIEDDAGHDAEIDPAAAVAPAEVIVPMDDDFLIVWPDGTKEAPADVATEISDRAVDDTADEPWIAGEALLPHRADDLEAPSVEPTVDLEPTEAGKASEPEVIAEPATDESPAVASTQAPESDPESVVGSEAAFESVVDFDPESDVEQVFDPEPVVEADEVLELEAGFASAPAVDPVFESESVFEAEESVEFEYESEPALEAWSEVPSTEPEAVAPAATGTDVEADAPHSETDPPTVTPGRVDFDVPALVLSDLPSADGAVPGEVSSAVIRAIRAIENASTTAPVVAPIVGSEPDTAAHDSPAAEPAPAPMGFAPPTLETSAEAMYAALAESAGAEYEGDEASEQAAAEVDPPEPRVASVVFVDDEEQPEPEDRAGALRRLISSLRRR